MYLEAQPSFHNLNTANTAMFTFLLQALIVTATLHALWKLFLQRFLIKSALDNIAGPPPQSFLFGEPLYP